MLYIRTYTQISARPPHFAWCMKFEMDRYIDRVPIRTQGSGTRYDGKVWYELLSSIRSVNGTTVMQGQLKKSTLNQGDRVSLEYHGRTYHGIVDVEASTNPNVTEIWIKSLEMPEEIPDVQPANSSGCDSATATEPLAPEHLLRQLETTRIATTDSGTQAAPAGAGYGYRVRA